MSGLAKLACTAVVVFAIMLVVRAISRHDFYGDSGPGTLVVGLTIATLAVLAGIQALDELVRGARRRL